MCRALGETFGTGAMRQLTCASRLPLGHPDSCMRERRQDGRLRLAPFHCRHPHRDLQGRCFGGRPTASTAGDHEPSRFRIQDEIVVGFER